MLAVQSSFVTDARAKSTIVNAIADGATENSTFYLDNAVNKMLRSVVKKLRDTLTKYANVSILNISGLIPEFVYYTRCAEFIGNLMEKGCVFCEPQPTDGNSTIIKNFYNIRLAANMENVSEIVNKTPVFS